MGYGEIIKRAWKITWRYRALWVLGLFAGVTGGSSGGGSNSNYRSSRGGLGSGSGSGSDIAPFSRLNNPGWWSEQIARVLPLLIAAGILLLVVGLLLAVLRVAARGGLVQAVNAIEENQPFTLRAAWGAGFGRFWPLLGLSLLLGLPIAIVGLGLGLVVVMSFLVPLFSGGSSGPATFAPVCGAFAIGVPLLIVGGVIFGIMHEMGVRSIMLDGVGVFDAAGGAWRSFRARIKDTLLMWLINFGLNIVSGIVVAIPIVVVIVATIVPAALTVRAGSYGGLIGMAVIAVVLVMVLTMAYAAVWGTFTSALWTIFYRRFTGREVVAVPTTVAPAAPDAPAAPESPAPAAPATPIAPAAPESPAAPTAPEGATL